jgi:hypothetical protein
VASPDRNETQRRLSGIHRWTWGLRTLWRCFRPGWLLVPFVFALAGGGAMVAGIWIPEKEPLERLAVELLFVTTALATLRLAFGLHPFFLWGTALLSVLLSREIHFAGTSEGVYLGLLALFALALYYAEQLSEYLASRFVVNSLAAGIFAYAIAVSLDARWWKPRDLWGGIPGEEIFHVPLEESMELVGHVLISLGVLCARRSRSD